jgi:putative hydrolase of the HAD superfamily
MFVSFDLAATLVHVRGSVGEQYAAIARRFGIEVAAADIDRVFPAALKAASSTMWPGPTRPPQEVAEWEKSFWRSLVQGIFERLDIWNGIERDRFDAYFDALFEHFTTASAWEIYPDVLPAFERLRRAGSRVGLITNFDGRVFKVIESLRLAPLIDSVTIPAQVGAAKPDPALFRHALAINGADAREAVHVGDSLSEDVAGARAAGMGAILLDRNGRHTDVTGVTRITTLDDLPSALKVSAGTAG